MSAKKKTICIVGNDPFNDAFIKRIPEAKDWNIVTVLENSDVQLKNESIDIVALYERARDEIGALTRDQTRSSATSIFRRPRSWHS